MSWAPVGRAVKVFDRRNADYHYTPDDSELTSTCTVLLSERKESYYLRMYGVLARDFGLRAGGYPPVKFFETTTNTHSDWTRRYNTTNVELWHDYIDSTTWPRGSPPGPVEFAVDKGRVDQVTRISIPRKVNDVIAVKVWRYEGNQQWTGYATPKTQLLDIHYKDPHVLQLPNGDWLMLMARYRMYDGATPGHNNSLSDIIGWYSDTPDFESEGVIGPFLLVEDTHCWSETMDYRLWLGVPAAVTVLGDAGLHELLVYYAVDECDNGYHPDGVGPSGLQDNVSQADYDSALDREGFVTGMACKRILLRDLLERVESEKRAHSFNPRAFPYTTEDDWTPYSYDPANAAVEGDLLGRVRFWFSDGWNGSDRAVRTFEEVYSTSNLRFRAPAPMVCGSAEDRVHLYFAVVLTSDTDLPHLASTTGLGSGHGIWHGASPPGFTFVNSDLGSIEVLTAGRDFICAPVSASDNRSPDQIAESYRTWPVVKMPSTPGAGASPSGTLSSYTGDRILYIDPDPVQLSDGSVWVAAGGDGFTAFEGAETDGCVLPEDTWADRAYPDDPLYLRGRRSARMIASPSAVPTPQTLPNPISNSTQPATGHQQTGNAGFSTQRLRARKRGTQ